MEYLPSVCYESELVVDEEPAVVANEAESFDADANNGERFKGGGGGSALFPSQDISDADTDLEQSYLNAIVTGGGTGGASPLKATNQITLAFFARMARGEKENNV